MKPSIVAESKIDGTFIHQSKCYRSLKLVGIVTKKFSTIHFNSIEKGDRMAHKTFLTFSVQKNHFDIKCNLDLMTLLVSAKTVTKLHNVTECKLKNGL